MSGNYTAYHVHTELSLLDSATKFEDYIAKAVELGQTAIAFTEHGNIYQWVAKKITSDCATARQRYRQRKSFSDNPHIQGENTPYELGLSYT